VVNKWNLLIKIQRIIQLEQQASCIFKAKLLAQSWKCKSQRNAVSVFYLIISAADTLRVTKQHKVLHTGWSDITVICGHITISMLCGNVILCEVKWWTFVALFEKIASVGFRKCLYYQYMYLTKKPMSQ